MEQKFFFSTKALIISDNKFLALYSNINGEKKWDIPGGRMEFGETAEETLKREIYEELGVTVKPIKLIDTWNYMHSENFQITGIIYYCEINSNEINLSDEHDGYEWIDIDHIFEIFTDKTFSNRMHGWDWDAIIDEKNKMVYQIEEVDILSLIPNNLYLNEVKIESVKKGYDSDNVLLIPPILVGIIDNELSLIDGHSRAWVAYKNGMSTIKAIVKPVEQIQGSEELYRRIHEIAKKNQIFNISHLSNSILSAEEHEEKWVGLCNKIIDELNE